MNNLNIIGRIVNDIKEYRNEEYNTVYFTIAVKRNKEIDQFIPCIAYNKTAHILIKYGTKGGLIGLSGRIEGYKTEYKGVQMDSLRLRVYTVTLVAEKKSTTLVADGESNRTAKVEHENTKQEPQQVFENEEIDDHDYGYTDETIPF